MIATSALDALFLQREVERFFTLEAELLDERRFTMARSLARRRPLLDADRRATSPSTSPSSNTRANRREANWFDEGKDDLTQTRAADPRRRPLGRGAALAHDRTSSRNVRIEKRDGGDITAQSRFFVCAYRLEHDVDLFIGKRIDVLRRERRRLKVAAPHDLPRSKRPAVAKSDHVLLRTRAAMKRAAKRARTS